jgi:hypothetical protein
MGTSNELPPIAIFMLVPFIVVPMGNWSASFTPQARRALPAAALTMNMPPCDTPPFG